MARLPMTSPPGKPRETFLNLARSGPRRIIEARSFWDKVGSTVEDLMPVGSMVKMWSWWVILAPRLVKISDKTATSFIPGTFLRVTGPEAMTEAAMRGRMEFLLPEISTCPLSGVPPVTIYWAMPEYYTYSCKITE